MGQRSLLVAKDVASARVTHAPTRRRSVGKVQDCERNHRQWRMHSRVPCIIPAEFMEGLAKLWVCGDCGLGE